VTILLSLFFLAQPAHSEPSPELEKRIFAAVAKVRNPSSSKVGLAVAIGRSGHVVYLLTAAHLVEGTDSVSVKFISDSRGDRPTRLLDGVKVIERTSVSGQDLALLRMTAFDEATPDVLRPKTGPFDKDKRWLASFVSVEAPGEPKLRTIQPSGPRSLRKGPSDPSVRFWACELDPQPGNSGGPLVAFDGRVIGICSGGAGQTSYFVHADEVAAFLRRAGLKSLFD
jgi:S1-C subfamily serine protease